MSSVRQTDWAMVRQAIVGEVGERLLRLMRDLFFGRAHAPRDPHVLLLAQQLGWIAADPEVRWRMTPEGARFAHSAREYCNWLDDERRLPYGIAETEMRGKAVLDVGCGFGRHVFAASRGAIIAVGLELEETYLRMSSILRAREGLASVALVRGHSERMPFAGNMFDVVICTRSLQYMDIRATIREMCRVMRVGGKAFLTFATFTHLLAKLWEAGAREKARTLKHIVNTLGVTWMNRRVLGHGAPGPNTLPVHPSRQTLVRFFDEAGLRLVSHSLVPQSGKDVLFVFERVR